MPSRSSCSATPTRRAPSGRTPFSRRSPFASAAHDWASVEKLLAPAQVMEFKKRETLEHVIERRAAFLTDYQDAAYAARYTDLVDNVRSVEAAKQPGATDLTDAVARYYFKLLAIKDEYEVARLYTETDFIDRIASQFEGDYTLRFHLAPPTLNKADAKTGEAKKSTYGPWMLPAFRVLAKLRRFRGGALDVFGRSDERRRERALIGDYEALVDELLARLTPVNYALAVSLASIPEHIRGYGHVKERHLKDAKAREAALLERFRAAPTTQPETGVALAAAH